jgi:hypothetical protein
MIDHTRKLIFVHIARTGGSSIETALVGKDWWLIEPQTKHISAKNARTIYGEDVWNTYTKFSIVRNPWDRIASMWATKWWHQASDLDEGCSFEEFIRKIKPHPHEIYDTLFYYEILNEKIDFILRFESLQDDFSRMLSSIGVGDIQLPHIEESKRQYYTTIYSEIEKQLIADLFDIDILRFGYSYEQSP